MSHLRERNTIINKSDSMVSIGIGTVHQIYFIHKRCKESRKSGRSHGDYSIGKGKQKVTENILDILKSAE